MKKIINNWGTTLFMFFIVSYLFLNKSINIGPSLNISTSLLIYPLTYLIVFVIYERFDISESKKSILISAALLCFFILLSIILCSISAVVSTNEISQSLRNILTPNVLPVLGFNIYYPSIIKVSLFIIVFILSHYIFIILYDGIKESAHYLVSFILAIMIAFILDQIMFLPLSCLPELLNETISIIDVIKMLTANFIVVIFSSLGMLFITPFIVKTK